jgi:hypothetical protein
MFADFACICCNSLYSSRKKIKMHSEMSSIRNHKPGFGALGYTKKPYSGAQNRIWNFIQENIVTHHHGKRKFTGSLMASWRDATILQSRLIDGFMEGRDHTPEQTPAKAPETLIFVRGTFLSKCPISLGKNKKIITSDIQMELTLILFNEFKKMGSSVTFLLRTRS